MNFKNVINSIFTYTPQKDYEFSISEDLNSISMDSAKYPNSNQKVQTGINQNLDFVKTTYNTLINSDIVIREFILSSQGKQYSAFLLYIDGMIDSNIMNDYILKPLMLRNDSNQLKKYQNRVISKSTKNNVEIRKIKKTNISDYILNCLLPQNNVKKIDDFEKIFSGVNSGNCALFIDTLETAFDIEVKGFKQRSIDSPNNEVVIKGSQEAFVENLRTNTSIIRRIINNENLIIENIDVGKITKTKCGICYMKNITNSSLVSEVKYRINNLSIDSLTSSRRIGATNFRRK